MKWKSLFEKKILDRGRQYFEDGAVEELEINNGDITAIVAGSEDYNIEIMLDNGVPTDMYCSCPYAADGYYCKHMAAVLFAYEAMPDKVKSLSERTLSPEKLIAKADEKTIRGFLLKALKNDKNLLLDFQIEIGMTEKNIDLKPYRQRIKSLIRQYTGYYSYIDYNRAYHFIDDVLDFLHNDIEKLSCHFLKEAFEISTELFIEVSSVDIDDSDGGLTEFGSDMTETWNKMLEKADKQLEMQMFDWFVKHIDGSVIDYMDGFIECFLFDNFTKKEYLLKKTELADKKISASGKSEYTKESWTMRRIELMAQLKMSKEEIITFCKKNYALRSVRKYLADMYEKNGDYENEAAVLEESIRLDENYAGIVCNCHERLAELYKRTGDKNKYHKHLWILTADFFDLRYYRELKSLHTDDWEETFLRLTEAVNTHDLPKIYVEEKLYNMLLQYVDEHCSIFILHNYESILAEHFPEYILEKYFTWLEKEATHTATRKTYAEWVVMLNKMATWRNGKKCVAKILENWRAAYKNRPAMLDELKKVKI